MSKPLIPLRPANHPATSLTQEEQSCLTWFVLSGCTKKDAFITFARPDMLESKAKAAVEDYVRQFFARKDVRDYLDAYQSTIENVLRPKKKENKPKKDDGLSMEERKAQRKTKLIEFAMNLIDNIESASDPESILKMADKLGIIDEAEDKQEEPRRYLPVSCSECAYRKFCEENCEDMCQECKYFQHCEENGIHFAKENMLKITRDEKRD